jgi:hypothetical protein
MFARGSRTSEASWRFVDTVLPIAAIGAGALISACDFAPDETAEVLSQPVVTAVREFGDSKPQIDGLIGIALMGLGVAGGVSMARRKRDAPEFVVADAQHGPALYKVPELPDGHALTVERRAITGVYPITTLAYDGGAVYATKIAGRPFVDATSAQ